jgi:hypothetical protein
VLLGLTDLVRRSEPVAPTLLCLQHDLLEVEVDALVDYVLASLSAWGVEREPVTLVECLPPDDLHIAAALRPALPHLEVLPFDRLWRDGFPTHPSQHWISTRFHPHLVAAAAGAWGVALATGSDYYATKHASLLDLGSGWTPAAPTDRPVAPQEPPTPAFSGHLPRLQQQKQQVADAVATLLVSPRGRRWGRRRAAATRSGSAPAAP